MKLYTAAISPNCRKVEAVLHQLGLFDDVEVHRLNLLAGEHRTDEVKTANPNMKVPTLIVGDMNLWESNPTMIYLCDRAGAEEFCPSDPKSRFELLRWMFWEVRHYNKALSAILWETVAKAMMDLGAPDQNTIDREMEEFRRFAAVLNEQLASSDFILGDTLTVADFAVGAYSTLAMLPQSRIPLDEYPNVKAWYLRLENVPAWAATAPEAAAEAAE
ncbi:glutathione S-transferase family protein [Roseibium sp.]|uniref:glutathione S-transferase family protein n=1 Tax=Roseibium sp. TaxID=1936156 RepID=UPI003D0A95B0